jgi:hypothetical protein
MDKSTVPLNTWYHVAYRLKDRTGSIYVNGKLSETMTGLSPPANAVHQNVTFGFEPNGHLVTDEIKFYNRALSVTEIQASYKNQDTIIF